MRPANNAKFDVRFFLVLFFFGLCMALALVAPAFVGRLFGHTWGMATASVGLIAWLLAALKWRVSPGVRLIILVGVCGALANVAFQAVSIAR